MPIVVAHPNFNRLDEAPILIVTSANFNLPTYVSTGVPAAPRLYVPWQISISSLVPPSPSLGASPPLNRVKELM
jgi:hypothetical protein